REGLESPELRLDAPDPAQHHLARLRRHLGDDPAVRPRGGAHRAGAVHGAGRPEHRLRVPVAVPAFVEQTIELPSGELRLLQPADAAEIPDDHEVQWAPLAPFWSVLWRSGVALARELDGEQLGGLRVLELGCGLGAPSLAAARGGAEALA